MTWTEKTIADLKPRDRHYTISGRGLDKGLVIRVLKSGTKTFYHFYYVLEQNKGIRLRIGKWPVVTLKTAREIMLNQKRERFLGHNIIAVKKVKKSKVGNLGQLLNLYANAPKKNGDIKKSQKSITSMFKFNIPEAILSRDANSISTQDFIQLLNVVSERSIITCNRITALLGSAFEFGKKYDFAVGNADKNLKFEIINNPISLIRKNIQVEKPGERFLTFKELSKLLTFKSDNLMFMDVIKLILAYGTRPSEVLHIENSEIDLENRIWTISGDRTKNGKSNILPLTDYTFNIISKYYSKDNKFLFEQNDQKIRYHALRFFIIDINKKLSLSSTFKLQDLRRTFKTLCSDLEISREILNAIQNHCLSSIDFKHYNRSNFINQKLKALNIFHAELEKMISNTNK